MAWSNPATYQPGDVITANEWNTQIRDNEIFLFNGKVAARGAVLAALNAPTSPALVHANLKHIVTIETGRVLVTFSICGAWGSPATSMAPQVKVDGTTAVNFGGSEVVAGVGRIISGTDVLIVTPGTHTFELFWNIAAGNGGAGSPANPILFNVIEI